MRAKAMDILNEEDHLSQIVKLVGPDALPDEQRLTLETARLLREGFLQQNATDDIDAYSTVEKQIRMLDLILYFHGRAQKIIIKGAPIMIIHDLPAMNSLIRMKSIIRNEDLAAFDTNRKQIDDQMDKLEEEYR